MPDLRVFFVAILLGLAGLMTFFASYAVYRKRVTGAKEFSLLMAAIAVYAGGYALELSTDSLEGMLTAIRFEYIGIVFSPVGWLLFSLRFATGLKPHRLAVAAAVLISLLNLGMVWTNDLHHLYYSSVWVERSGPFPVFGLEKGPWYWVTVATEEILIIAGSVAVLGFAIKADRRRRRQAVAAAVGAAVPWICSVAYLCGFMPWGLEPTPIAMAGGSTLFFLAVFKLGLLDLVPAAREEAIDAIAEGLIVFDSKGRALDSNPAARAMLGPFGLSEPLPASIPGSAQLFDLATKGGGKAEFRVESEGGGARVVSAEAFPVRDSRGEFAGSCVLIRDITENAVLLARLESQASTDALTGLSNRRRFFDVAPSEIELARRKGSPIALCVLDIDLFKGVNDRLGHAAGDAALAAVGRRISSALRSSDQACRYGGEEFALLLPDTGPEAAYAAAERLRSGIAELAIPWRGPEIRVTASVGLVSGVPGGSDGLDELLARADCALYASKRAGRNRTTLWRPEGDCPIAP